MAKLQDKLSSVISRLCAVILGMLGFGCSSSEEPNIPVMYGVPIGSFEIKGEVNDEDGNPVAEAEVRVLPPHLPSTNGYIMEGFTGKDGLYSITANGIPSDTIKVICLPPIDSDFEPDSVMTILKYTEEEDRNGEMWYSRHGEGVANFKLKKKAE